MAKRCFWTVWDNIENDYGLTISMEIPMFNERRRAESLAVIWNWQKEGRYCAKKVFIKIKEQNHERKSD